jgi:hypothetical protein
VKCDRGHPRCGWCTRNGATCEYRERKKPGLRAGKQLPEQAKQQTLNDRLFVRLQDTAESSKLDWVGDRVVP